MDDRTLRRLEQLVRLAESTQSDGERGNCLAEAVRLFDREVESERIAKQPRRRPAPTAQRQPVPYQPPPRPRHWEVQAFTAGRCALCHGPYGAGETVWMFENGSAMHAGYCAY